jgi:thiamine biosynthesis lipoprotein
VTSAPARTLAVASILLATACAPPAEVETDRFFALGTVVELRFHGLGEAGRASAGVRARQVLDAAVMRWSVSDPGSELAILNRSLQETGRARPGPELADDLRTALALAERSGGRFDPAIGSLVELWGFQLDERPPGPPPTDAEITQLLDAEDGAPFHRRVRWDEGEVAAAAGIALDLGGFAKGRAAEAVATALREAGVHDVIINLGGDLVVLGAHGDRPWRIAIRDPRSVRAIASLDAFDGEAVFTSGDYERGFEFEGRRFHHILDPYTGYPTEGLSSATVVHGDATLADAAATALMVAGPESWRQVAEDLGIELVLVVHPDGSIEMSDAMRPRVTLEVSDAGS